MSDDKDKKPKDDKKKKDDEPEKKIGPCTDPTDPCP